MWDGPKEKVLEWVDAPSDGATSERRRMQNRIAQRNHRKRCKEKQQGDNEQTETNMLVWKTPCTIPRPPAKVPRDQKQQFQKQQQQKQKQQPQQKLQHTFKHQPIEAMAEAPHNGTGSMAYGMPKLDHILLDPMDDFSEFLAAGDVTALPPSPGALQSMPKSATNQTIFSSSDFTALDSKQHFDTAIHFDHNVEHNSNNVSGTLDDLNLSGSDTNVNPSNSSWDHLDTETSLEHNHDLVEDLDTLSTDNLKFSGYNALHLAAYHGQPRIIRLLLTSKRVDANSVTRQGVSALHIAAASVHRIDAARELLELGADAWLQDSRGLTALHVAVESGSASISDRAGEGGDWSFY
ncbi:hypothetical protein B0T16DRAFT_390044 [Cercophora newfieldiana]|uniref:BZIP domain-containing protein n=1 Tax=Cercophora newfieldiana TaxID=92897 RepID=A0AA39Y5U4_9PEZI|nr:hypothetical protein B0T16DRAFT_390044 [Cercophora newfieldiana]